MSEPKNTVIKELSGKEPLRELKPLELTTLQILLQMEIEDEEDTNNTDPADVP